MGSFSGHVHPGLYYLVFGIRWTYCVFMRYYLGRRETALGRTNPRSFRNSLLYPSSCKPGVPMEAYVLLGAVLFEFLGEFVMGLYEYGLLVNGQHMTALFFFVIAFTIAMLKEHRVVTMPNVEYALTALAFLVQAFIFYHHTNGTSPLEVQLHMNVVLMCIVVAVAMALEAIFQSNLIAAVVRCLTVSIMGTWFCQVAFILYFPYYQVPWDHNSIMHMHLATMIFVWHIAANLLFVFAMSSFVVYRVSKMSPTQVHNALDKNYFNFSSSRRTDSSLEEDKYLIAQSDDEAA